MKNLQTTCACTDCTCEKPSANLTINKGRLKKYDKNSETPTYYLKDGQEFELELFNPKTFRLLVKIKINGSLISQSGIVLNPGQRIFLDRYIDVSKKFKFETYEVGTSKAVENAIKNNGDIEFLFYEEKLNNNHLNGGITWVNHGWDYNYYNNTGNPIYGDYGNTSLTNTNGGVTMDSLNNSSFTTTSLATTNISNNSSRPIKILKGVLRTKTKETGRVELGSDSKQEFKTISANFNPYTTYQIRYKILPVSNKNIEVQDLKKYCSNCGANMKKNHKFCTQCGSKG